jgi:hypothetical protein
VKPTAVNSTLYATGGMLTVNSQTWGYLSVPMGIAGSSVPANEAIWDCASGCSWSFGLPAPASSTWVVDIAPSSSISSEAMNVTAPPITVNYQSQVGPTISWGYFYLQHNAGWSWYNSAINCPTGTAAAILGLTCNSAGYPGVPNSYAFLATPGPASALPEPG